MFKMTVVGLMLAVGAILTGQWMEGSSLSLLFQPSALLIVVGGTLGAVLAQSSPADIKQALNMLKWLKTQPMTANQRIVDEMMTWSKVAHKDGVLKLDAFALKIQDKWLRKGLEMVVDRFDVGHIREALSMELRIKEARYKSAIRIWESAAGYAPTIGIVGSVLGLLHVMSTLQDPQAMASGLAVCFVATFYGLALANLVFLPLTAKLKSIAYELILQDEMRLEGLCLIAQNRRPVVLERTLSSYCNQPGKVVELRRAA